MNLDAARPAGNWRTAIAESRPCVSSAPAWGSTSQTEADPVAVLKQRAVGVIGTVGQPRAELAGIAVAAASQRARRSARRPSLSVRYVAPPRAQRVGPLNGASPSFVGPPVTPRTWAAIGVRVAGAALALVPRRAAVA